MNKKTVTMILVLLTLSSALALEGESTDSVTVTGLLITEVSPADEAVTLTNIGGSRVDLGDYTLTDGEGTLSFSRGYGLDPGHSVTVSKESGTDWFNSRDGTITFSSPTIAKSGSFILADSGDEVILKKGGQVVDSVCYGKFNGVEGWTGPAVSLKSGQYLLRTHDTDSDTFSDWVATKPGWTNLEPSSGEWFEAVVHPFSFPESRGDPVFAAIMSAEHTIDISIYILSSPELVALLCQMESRGVEVRVMVEGRPLGVDTSTELSLMKSLTDAGGEVRVINPPGGSGGRYTYVHNKYAVIDSETVVITSENWTSGNMGEHGNRGWGAVLECQEYARYMEDVFENDFTTVWGDVRPFNDLYPDSRPYGTLPFVEPRSGLGDGFEARVRPVLSPDNSFDSLRGIITRAEERLYAEQMDLGGSLSSVSGETPIAWLSQASSRGVDTKFILDSSQSDSGTHRTYVNLISSTTSVQAVNVNGGDGFSLIHNKGLVIDDQVWIGSVNWTDTSFMNNRESAVIIESREVSDCFAELFLKDFGVNVYTVEERGMDITVRIADAGGRPMMVLSVDAPADHEYVWTIDGEKVPFTGNAALGEMSAGTHVVTVTMADTEIFASAEFVVPERNGSGGNGMLLPALLCGMGVLALGVVVAVFRDRQEARRRRPSSRQVFAPPRRVTYSFRSGGRRR